MVGHKLWLTQNKSKIKRSEGGWFSFCYYFLSKLNLFHFLFLLVPVLPSNLSEPPTPSSAATTDETLPGALGSSIRQQVTDRKASFSSLRPQFKAHLQPPSRVSNVGFSFLFFPLSLHKVGPSQKAWRRDGGGRDGAGPAPINLMIRWSHNLALFPFAARRKGMRKQNPARVWFVL